MVDRSLVENWYVKAIGGPTFQVQNQFIDDGLTTTLLEW